MGIVKNIGLAPEDVDDGRIVSPGGQLEGVDLKGDLVRAKIAHGSLAKVSDDADDDSTTTRTTRTQKGGSSS